jgi:hypothetical protein
MKKRTLTLRAVLFALLMIFGVVVPSNSADARVEKINIMRIDGNVFDVGHGKFLRPQLGSDRYESGAWVKWGDNRNGDVAVNVSGWLRSNHDWWGCVNGRIHIFSTEHNRQVSRGFSVCNNAFAPWPFGTPDETLMSLTSSDLSMNRVRICASDANNRRNSSCVRANRELPF